MDRTAREDATARPSRDTSMVPLCILVRAGKLVCGSVLS